jgi:hypothetical protein
MNLVTNFTHKYNPNPRLSASQVSEYLSANATSRRRIITEAKYPPTFLTVRYDDAREAMCGHLTNGKGKDVLGDALEGLKRKMSVVDITDWKKSNHRLCGEAIEAYRAYEKALGMSKVTFIIPNIGNSKLKISGVNVSVSLDLMTEVSDAKGGTTVGGTILCLWKTRAADIPSRCQAMAMLASEVVKQFLKANQVCDPRMCMAVDIFGGKVYRGRAQQKMLFKTVENSCGEIATIWPSIEPPANYNGPPIPKA